MNLFRVKTTSSPSTVYLPQTPGKESELPLVTSSKMSSSPHLFKVFFPDKRITDPYGTIVEGLIKKISVGTKTISTSRDVSPAQNSSLTKDFSGQSKALIKV